MKNFKQLFLFQKNQKMYRNSHPPIQNSDLQDTHLFHCNTDAKYTRCMDREHLMQIKWIYLFGSISAFLLFMLACILETTSSFSLFTIIMQASGIIVFLFLFRNLITYLCTSNSLKEYEYHACILFYKANAFLWLCSNVCAMITVISMIVSYQRYDLFALFSFLCCSAASLFLYHSEMCIFYTKDA